MPSQAAAGPTTTTPGTPQTLATITTPGTYQLHADTNALSGAEYVDLTLKVKVLSGGTSRQAAAVRVAAGATDPVSISPPVAVLHELVVTLLQTGGSARSVPWEIVRLDQ